MPSRVPANADDLFRKVQSATSRYLREQTHQVTTDRLEFRRRALFSPDIAVDFAENMSQMIDNRIEAIDELIKEIRAQRDELATFSIEIETWMDDYYPHSRE